jgi:NAD-dependent SIR2 family protein deacetylase
MEKLINFAAKNALKPSQALVITAGAGMGSDSGLPVFRGEKDLWEHYPFFAKSGMKFSDAASPQFFEQNP